MCVCACVYVHVCMCKGVCACASVLGCMSICLCAIFFIKPVNFCYLNECCMFVSVCTLTHVMLPIT